MVFDLSSQPGCYFSFAVLSLLFSSCAAKKLDIFPLLPYLSVSDEGMDLLSCLSVWAGLRVCLPSPPLPCCLSACLAVLPHHSSAQSTKPWFSATERVPACVGIPTGGGNSSPHCNTIIACQVPFLFFFFSCLSSSLSPSYSFCAPSMALFSGGNTLFVSSHLPSSRFHL